MNTSTSFTNLVIELEEIVNNKRLDEEKCRLLQTTKRVVKKTKVTNNIILKNLNTMIKLARKEMSEIVIQIFLNEPVELETFNIVRLRALMNAHETKINELLEIADRNSMNFSLQRFERFNRVIYFHLKDLKVIRKRLNTLYANKKSI